MRLDPYRMHMHGACTVKSAMHLLHRKFHFINYDIQRRLTNKCRLICKPSGKFNAQHQRRRDRRWQKKPSNSAERMFCRSTHLMDELGNIPKVGVEITDMGLDNAVPGIVSYYEGCTTPAEMAKESRMQWRELDFVALSSGRRRSEWS